MQSLGYSSDTESEERRDKYLNFLVTQIFGDWTKTADCLPSARKDFKTYNECF